MKTENWPSLIHSVMKNYCLQKCLSFLCFLLVLFKLMGIKVQTILTPSPHFYNFLNCESQHRFFLNYIFQCRLPPEFRKPTWERDSCELHEKRCSHRFSWCACQQVNEFPRLISEQLPDHGRAVWYEGE